jgi:DNA-binding transcriptional LysR family regulator
VELDWLRTFLAVLDRGGFSAAAEQVHRSQSRVSAHIAALERELGVTLIDRGRRPARVTHAGEVFARHARDILAAVGSARSAVGAARGLDEGRLTLLTTPCLAAAFVPGALAGVAAEYPKARFAILEDGRLDAERRFLDEGVGLAVLPTSAVPAAPGLRKRILWEEPVRALVPAGHPFTRLDGPLPLAALLQEPLVLTGAAGDGVPEVLELLALRGVVATPTATADCPATVAALVGVGLGVGLLTAVAARAVVRDAGPADVVAVPLADAALVRRVGAFWHDALAGSDLGHALLREILASPLPPGATPVPPPTAAAGVDLGDGVQAIGTAVADGLCAAGRE